MKKRERERESESESARGSGAASRGGRARADTPPPGAPFPMSTDLLSYEYALGGNAVPPGIGADTWYPSWDADGNLYSSCVRTGTAT